MDKIALVTDSTCDLNHEQIEKYKDMKIEIFDSLSLSLGTGAIVLECGKMISSGKSFMEIVQQLPSIRDRIKLYYVLENLQYLIKGGRIGRVSGTIGEVLNLKPIISVSKEGIYYTYAKVRGRRQSISKLIAISKETLSLGKAKVWVLHGGAREEGEDLYNSIAALFNITELGFGDISSVAGVHTGPGLLGVCIMKED